MACAAYSSMVLVLAALCFAIVGRAATVQFRQSVNGYSGTADTHVRLDQPSLNFANASAVRVDNDNPFAHGLLRFDDLFGTGPGQVTPRATIERATLTLRTSDHGGTVWFHRMLIPWHETNTWNQLSTNGYGLQADDMQMASTPDFSFTPGLPVPRIDSFDVTETVKAWFAGRYPSYGWGITSSSPNGWQFESSENVTFTNRPLLEIEFYYNHGVEILQQPASVITNEGSTVTFSVMVDGVDVEYQWFKDNAAVPDATNSVYVIPVVYRRHAGTYYVVASNGYGDVSSSNAVLSVSETSPPYVRCAYDTNDPLTVFVLFSQIVTNATDPANYSITSGIGEGRFVSAATHPGGASEGSVVVLTLDRSTPFTHGESYTLNVGNIFDRFGHPIDSTPVQIHLYAQRLFALGESHSWKFDDSGADLGTSWKDTNFDDTTWKSGPALLGFEPEPLAEPLRTPVSRNNAVGGIILTHYFRTRFYYPGPPGKGVLTFRTVLDDAAAIYLNGSEIFRLRLPAGPLDYQTSGIGEAVDDAAYEGPFTACVDNLRAGENILAVEVHQTGFSSSDMAWGMELFAVSPTAGSACIVTQPQSRVVEVGQPVTFAVDFQCGVAAYQWYKNGVPVPGATNSSYTIFNALRSDEGSYQARISTGLAAYDSAAAQLTVYSCCPPELHAISETNQTIVLVFDEQTTNGLDLANFEVRPVDDSHTIWLASAAYTSATSTGRTLLVTIDASTPLRPGVPYKMSIQGIEDLFQNRMAPVTLPIPRFPLTIMPTFASQSWKYDTSGTDFSNRWYRLDFDDSSWPTGAPVFDAKRAPRTAISGQPVRTFTTLSNANFSAQLPTHYFRTRFNYAGPLANTLGVRPFIDDGAVFYLNGREFLRVRMPLEPFSVRYSTLATATVGDADFEPPIYARVTNLLPGENLLAVEVHQSDLTSADLTFGMELSLLSPTPPAVLAITLSSNRTSAVLTWLGSGILQQTTNLSDANAWSNIENTVSGHSVPLTGSTFFRLYQP